MRKGCFIAAALALIVIAVTAVYLTRSPAAPEPATLLSLSRSELLKRAPDDAEEVAVLPSAGAFLLAARDHPITSSMVAEWESRANSGALPQLLRSADVVAWRKGDNVSALAKLDPPRHFLARIYVRLRPPAYPVSFPGNGMILLGTSGTAPMSAERLEEMKSLAGAAKAHLFVYQSPESDASYPPVERPAMTAVTLERDRLEMVSRAEADSPRPATVPPPFPLPNGAMLVGSFATPPSVLEDFERVVPAGLSAVLGRGGMVVLYDIEKRTLLPRPVVVYVVTADASHDRLIEEALDDLPSIDFGSGSGVKRRIFHGTEIVTRPAVALSVSTARKGEQFLVALDERAIELYLQDGFGALPRYPQDSVWAIRLFPRNFSERLEQAGNSPALQLLARKAARSLKRVQGWLRHLKDAREIVAINRREGSQEVLTVTVLAGENGGVAGSR